ncbi:hypothetical protein C0134_03410 [Moraxella catarrhalis]|jgi:hypothetical protein|uniref:Uncharacterized protein n=2 Tax=Moraxella catarrhalis TaxID=480 RepID=A0A3A9M5L4_MORCA|nr:hypothetical protein [Moraxella catarrhalis]ADG60424.1 hypothetical protein MCR_0152 [Moraxella catarrhalis BBH18]AIK01127.1 hypothetical protein DR90_1749 [Moraxella catarrhalis]ARE66573.1 hypothetical protein MC195_07600 [Moraxella catarrhalis]AVL50495.1 hypothetical protein CEP83_05595 [Moraxella catarrhalis]AXT94278.1 hypothetical protein SQ00_00690 [Moraxella catarrhalis]
MQAWFCVYEILADEAVWMVSATAGVGWASNSKRPPMLWLKTAISWILILIAVQIIIRFVMDMGEVFNNSYLTIK